jgi:3-hydroxybutyryl-CoA dehydrogenase
MDEIRNVTIIGAGLMGSGIAHVIAASGFEVTMRSRRGKDGLDILRKGVRKAVDRGTLTEDQAILLLSNIKVTPSLKDAVESADLIIEVVIEDLAVKNEIFRETSVYCPQNAIIASNTSSLSIFSIAEGTKRPEQVVGMHFFNPAPVMKLIEVVQSPLTSKETVSRIIAFSQKIDKFPLVVKDSPGFVVNRILMPAINAAAFVLM